MLGLLYNENNITIEADIDDLIKQRNEARKNKDWKTADEIRDKLNSMNVIIEDTPQGVRWKIKSDV